jgi:hypothetical protein
MKKLLALIVLCSLYCYPQAVQLPISAAGNISAGGTTCATTNACVSLNLPVGSSTASVNITGTFSGTLNFEQSGDFGLTWVAVNASPQPTGNPTTSTTSTGLFLVNAGGPTSFRVRGSAGWSSGTAAVTLTATSGVGIVTLGANLPAGTAILGKVGIDQTTPGTTNGVQVNAALPAGNNNIGNVQGEAASNQSVTNPIVSGVVGFNVANGNPTVATSGNQVSALGDLNGSIFVRPEGGPNLFNCSVTLSTATTTQCQAAPGAGLRAYLTGFIINTTTAGTASAIQAIQGTGSNCGTNTANLSAIAFPNTAVGLTSVEYSRVGLVPVAAEAICFKQTGTPGTSVIEAYGVIAP